MAQWLMMEGMTGEIVGTQFSKTMEGVFFSPTDFLFLDAAMDATTISGLTKRMGKVFTLQ